MKTSRPLTAIITCLFLLFSVNCIAQNPSSDFKYALKLSNQSSFSLSSVRDVNGNRIGGNQLRMFHLSPGLLMRTAKGNFLDFSLENIALNFSGKATTASPTFNPYRLGLSVKAGYYYSFFKQKTSHWVPALGVEAMPFFSTSRVQQLDIVSGSTGYSYSLTPYARSSSTLGVQTFLSPRIMWFPGKRFFMDASLNLPLVALTYSHSATTDPSQTQEFNRVRTRLLDVNQSLRLSVGIGVKL